MAESSKQWWTVILVGTSVDAVAIFLLVASVVGWTDISIVIPLLLLVAGNGLMVGVLLSRRNQ